MKVKTLIKKLEKMDPEAEVRLHDKAGEPVLFVLSAKKIPDVWLQTESDVDMADEIQSVLTMPLRMVRTNWMYTWRCWKQASMYLW